MVLAVLIISVLSLFLTLGLLYHWKSQSDLRVDMLQGQIRQSLDGNSQILQNQLGLLTKQVDDRLGQGVQVSQESNKQVNERLDSAARVIGELQNRLGKLSEANTQIVSFAKDISSLNDILKNPKSRGNLGEYFLCETLSSLLPRERYEIQYRFKNNEQVDAIVRVGDYLLSIDSKFPLEGFSRMGKAATEDERLAAKKQFISDVKKHIDAIAKKYIQPAENTFDFALMCVPAESVFYEVIVRDNAMDESLQEYAQRKKVIPVSPNSLYAYLGALMYALRGERMQKDVLDIMAQMRTLTVDLGRFADDFRLVGKHLNNTRNSFEEAEKRLNRYQDRLEKMQGDSLLPEVSVQTNMKLIS